MRLLSVLVVVFFFSPQAFAIECYFTVVKDNCWINYDVSILLKDSVENKELVTVEVPKGQSWARKKFPCYPGQKMKFFATYSPVFWQNHQGKVYAAKRHWSLPEKVGEKDVAWDVGICYPREFSGVPLPPDAEGNCRCLFDKVDPIPQ